MVACHGHIDFGWDRGAWNAFWEILPPPLSPIEVNKYRSCGYGISYHPCLIVHLYRERIKQKGVLAKILDNNDKEIYITQVLHFPNFKVSNLL